MKKRIRLILLALLSVLPLTGCNMPGVEANTTTTPTLGQQLIDLQKAKEAGALTPEQYEAKKASLLSK